MKNIKITLSLQGSEFLASILKVEQSFHMGMNSFESPGFQLYWKVVLHWKSSKYRSDKGFFWTVQKLIWNKSCYEMEYKGTTLIHSIFYQYRFTTLVGFCIFLVHSSRQDWWKCWKEARFSWKFQDWKPFYNICVLKRWCTFDILLFYNDWVLKR